MKQEIHGVADWLAKRAHLAYASRQRAIRSAARGEFQQMGWQVPNVDRMWHRPGTTTVGRFGLQDLTTV
jgi:hypothetical protein